MGILENASPIPQKSESVQHTTCALSGLPLGYIPTRKIRVRPTIAFSALTLAEVRSACAAAQRTQRHSQERVFAFFSLFHKFPPSLLILQTQNLRPAWDDPRLGNLLNDMALGQLLETVSALNVLPSGLLLDFPSFRVSTSASFSNNDLRDFPAIFARWYALLQSSKQDAKRKAMDSQEFRLSRALFFRGGKAPTNPFAPTKTNGAEIAELAHILADFYERAPTKSWESFVRNPSQLSSQRLRKVIQDVIAANISEADDFSDELQLSLHFRRWLEENLLRVEQQESEAAKAHRIIRDSEANALQSLLSSNSTLSVVQLLADRETVGKPKREEYASMAEYIEALQRWKKVQV